MLEFHLPQEAAQWLRSRVTGTLQTDSRLVQPGDGFIAWPGASTDARRFVDSALAGGASACLVEREGVDAWAFTHEGVAAYPALKAASGPVAAAYFEQPTQALDVMAVTGTNGKTSIAWWLAQALSNLKQHPAMPCALVGTLGIGQVPKPSAASTADAPDGEGLRQLVPTGLTTPDPVLLQASLRRFVDQGVRACAIEASSIGLEEHRLDGCQIRTAIFSNFTQDHLDYHGSMQAYWLAKAQLFQWPGLKSAVINVDDVRGAALAQSLQAHEHGQDLDVWTVSVAGPARLQAQAIRYDAQGLSFSVVEGLAHEELHSRVIGTYNVSNLLCVIAALRSLGVPLAAAVDTCHHLSPVPGRMECVGEPGQPLAVVDYAHTPDALGKALEALRTLSHARGGQLWCVFGCGGDRDASKRPLMGSMAGLHADQIVVTSDNPRSEKPQAIISQILLGLTGRPGVTVQADRALAIAQTLAEAGPHDVVLVAGKGHEDYQETAGQRQPFSDLAHVRQALRQWAAPASVGGRHA
jgi:UDP-N-acetylmuramyl-tripeptide synthetase